MKSRKKSKAQPAINNDPAFVTRYLTSEEIDALRKHSKDTLNKLREMAKLRKRP
jgi:hypothetical protein